MDLSAPYRTVASGSTGAVLMVLGSARRPATIGEIARRAELSKSGVSSVIKRLCASGLVRVVPGGYEVNEQHVLAPALEVLVRARAELFDRIRRQLTGWTVEPIGAVVFGSAARGDGGFSSDIDILLVSPDLGAESVVADRPVEEAETVWVEQIGRLEELVYQWSGNRGEIIVYSVEEAVRAHNAQLPLFQNLRNEGIVLVGQSPAALATAHRAELMR